MRRAIISSVLVILTGWTLLAQTDQAPTLKGFSPEAARAEADWEQKFRAIPSPDILRENMRLLTAHPHHVGSPYNEQDEEWIASQFQQWGWDTHVETFKVLFPTPIDRLVEMTEPTHFVAKLQEPAIPEDPTSNQQSEQLPPYNAYSIDGDVTAPLVYVNYGVPDDYEQLERMGISVQGAIVIARYGNSWRGIKPKVAAEHGAVGCILYSDPREDGFSQGDVFPEGAWRPPDGIQRGSVMDMPQYPGDPLTPGVGATADAKRLDIKDVKVFTKIPVLPISYGDALPLLKALAGRTAPPAWRGGLGITYHVGRGPAVVHLRVKSSWDMKDIHDVIATIPGTTEADQWVIRGNHYDAWVNGAQDPISGMSAELEEARALGELRKAGWKPKRTIIYAAWDGEEAGLLGSVEWVETHADELRAHAVAYINSDTNSRGYLEVGGSHTLETFVNDVSRAITDPEEAMSVWQRRQSRRVAGATFPDEREHLSERATWPIDALGSGSDYAAFLDFVGVASINLAYGGEAGAGVYHSAYDDFYWYTHFDDKTFVYGRALAQTSGTAVLRLADADLLPMNFADLSDVVHGYVREIEQLVDTESRQIRERNKEIADGLYAATSDPAAPVVPPQMEPLPPHINFMPLETSLEALDRSAAHYQRASDKANENGGAKLAGASLASVNEEVMQTERALIDPQGLPGREWYKHQLYAPGAYTGYSVKTIPAVREAIEQKQWDLAGQSIVNVAHVIDGEAAAIERAAGDLERATK